MFHGLDREDVRRRAAAWHRWAYWAAAVIFFGLGAFMGAFADKTGGNDWNVTLLATGVGKAASQIVLCLTFKAPLVPSWGGPGVLATFSAAWLYVAAYLCFFGLVSGGADMAVAIPMSQLCVLVPVLYGWCCAGERLGVGSALGVALMLGGALLLCMSDTDDGESGGTAAAGPNSTVVAAEATLSDAAADPGQLGLGGFLLLMTGAVLSMGVGQTFYAKASTFKYF